MSQPTKWEIFKDDLHIVVVHYRQPTYVLLAVGFAVGFALPWIL